MKIILFILTVFPCATCLCWEEDPRLEEHNKLTDYLIKLGDKQVKEGDPDMIDLLNFIYNERKKAEEQNE